MKVLLLLLTMPALAIADPGSATRYLMTEKASLFDIAMIRLDLAHQRNMPFVVDSYVKGAGLAEAPSHNAGIYYNFDKDIFIASFQVVAPIDSYDKAIQGCKLALGSIHLQLALDLDTHLGHYGYTSTNRPKSLEDEIRKRVVLKCSVGTLWDLSSLEVTRQLGSEEYTVHRKDDNDR